MSKHINIDRNPAILNDFLGYLLNLKNYSIGTVKGYECDLIIFFKFIIEYKKYRVDLKNISIFMLLQVNPDDVIAFLVYLNCHKNNCAYTRRRKTAAVRKFYKWLLMTTPESQKENPTNKIPLIESSFRLPKYLTLVQAKKMQKIFTFQNSKNHIRNNTIITLFLTTGMRISELIGINVNDINYNEKSIIIIGKGNKERMVYFNDYCKQQLLKYQKIRNQDEEIKDKEAFFISKQHKRICKSSIENICKKAYKLMELDGHGYTVHSLRHTAATIMYRYVNQDLLFIKDFLGHESIKATEIYTHVYNDQVKEAVEKNPLSDYEVTKLKKAA